MSGTGAGELSTVSAERECARVFLDWHRRRPGVSWARRMHPKSHAGNVITEDNLRALRLKAICYTVRVLLLFAGRDIWVKKSRGSKYWQGFQIE